MHWSSTEKLNGKSVLTRASCRVLHKGTTPVLLESNNLPVYQIYSLSIWQRRCTQLAYTAFFHMTEENSAQQIL